MKGALKMRVVPSPNLLAEKRRKPMHAHRRLFLYHKQAIVIIRLNKHSAAFEDEDENEVHTYSKSRNRSCSIFLL